MPTFNGLNFRGVRKRLRCFQDRHGACLVAIAGMASIQDITNPVAPFSVSGNNALQFNMTDNGSPGSSDTIGITLWNASGGIWFSTNWVGSPPASAEQALGGGNLEVH